MTGVPALALCAMAQPNRVAGGLLPPAPTPPYMRVRVRRFLAVLADKAALFLCHADRGPVAQPIGFNAPAPGQQWSCLPAKFSPSRVREALRCCPARYPRYYGLC